MYSNKYFLECIQKADSFKNSLMGKYYSQLLCLNEISNTKNYEEDYSRIKEHITDSYSEIMEYSKDKLCTLHKGHTGPCTFSPHLKLFANTKIHNKITSSIYNTPGNDDYVFKNRASRLFPIVLSDSAEKQIRNKNTKLKCAIPLKEHSTPFLLATAYVDFLVLIVNVKGIEINESDYSRVLESHKTFLMGYYFNKSRKIFSDDGYTICPVTFHEFSVNDIADASRDSRFNPQNNDAQLGHIIPRNESQFTIFGTNILLMSRRGNLIIGEYSILSETWINELKGIIANY